MCWSFFKNQRLYKWPVRLRKVVRPLWRAQNMVISISTCHGKLPLAPWYSALLGRLIGSALMSNSSIVTKLSNCSHYFQTQLYCLQPSGHTNYQSEPLLGRGDGSADNRRMSAGLTEQLGLFFSSIVVSSSSVKYKVDTEINGLCRCWNFVLYFVILGLTTTLHNAY